MTDYSNILGFQPSEYQRAIFDFVTHGVGNAVVSARAGSAKTTTMVAAMKMIHPSRRCMFIAFNKSIVGELGKKVADHKNCEVSTVHSMGLKMIERNIGHPEVDEHKYTRFIRSVVSEMTEYIDTNLYFSNCCKLIDIARFNMCQTAKEVSGIAVKYGVDCVYDECETVEKAMKWGCSNTDIVDYTDMVWLPNEMCLSPRGLQYDWLFLDEGQDFSVAYVQLIRKCFKRNTRFVAVLDEYQSINGFAGASKEAIDELKSMPHTQTFKLPVCYRCDSSIVERASVLVRDIVCRSGADKGVIDHDAKLSDFRDGDMVLSRFRAPLVKLYGMLASNGIRCRMNGENGAETITELVQSCKSDSISADFKTDGVIPSLFARIIKERDRLSAISGMDKRQATLTRQVMSMYDNTCIVMELARKCSNKTELLGVISDVFSDKEGGVCLSTVHKAKGLEADNVYVICPHSMPSPIAATPFEEEQERNLIYVAITRAKHKLGYVRESEFNGVGATMKPDNIVNDIDRYEMLCRNLYGDKMFDVDYAVKRVDNKPVVKEEYVVMATKKPAFCDTGASGFDLSDLG